MGQTSTQQKSTKKSSVQTKTTQTKPAQKASQTPSSQKKTSSSTTTKKPVASSQKKTVNTKKTGTSTQKQTTSTTKKSTNQTKTASTTQMPKQSSNTQKQSQSNSTAKKENQSNSNQKAVAQTEKPKSSAASQTEKPKQSSTSGNQNTAKKGNNNPLPNSDVEAILGESVDESYKSVFYDEEDVITEPVNSSFAAQYYAKDDTLPSGFSEEILNPKKRTSEMVEHAKTVKPKSKNSKANQSTPKPTTPISSEVAGIQREKLQHSGTLAPYIDSLLEKAQALIGKPYQSPSGTGITMDCSGYVMYLYSLHGKNLPHSSRAQASMTIGIDTSEVMPGDLLFFTGRNAKSGVVGHVGMVLGRNEKGQIAMIHSSIHGIKIDYCFEKAYYVQRFMKAGRLPFLMDIPKEGLTTRAR